MANPTPEQKRTHGGTEIRTDKLYLRVILPNGNSATVGSRKGVFMQIVRNVRQWCPYLYFELDDTTGALRDDSAKLNDGTLLGIVIGRGPYTETSMWRCYGTPERHQSTENPHVFTYIIRALPDGISDTLIQKPTRSWTDTSTNAIASVVRILGFDFYTNLHTQDNMTWLSDHRTWKEYIEHIASHAYAGDDAVIMDCIDSVNDPGGFLHGTYSIVNVPDLFRGQAVMYFHHGANFSHVFPSLVHMPEVSCAQARHYSESGHNGYRCLYGMDSQEIHADGSVSYHSKVTPMDASRIPDVSHYAHERGQLSPKVVPAPLPCGNVHDSYIKAEHIFTKSRGLYGQHVEVLVAVPTRLKLFDLVVFTQATPTGELMQEISGYYFVSGKNTFVSGNQYWEKLEFTCGGLS